MRIGTFLLCLAFAGCVEPDPPAATSRLTPPVAPNRFDPGATATVRGRVAWRGDVPSPTPIESIVNPLGFPGPPGNPLRRWPNPNEPRVTRGGLAGAFVWLEGVDPARARQCSLPPVHIELSGRMMSPTRGLVRAGEPVEVVSRDPFHHSVQMRGANHFSLTLPHADRPRRRVLDTPGLVEVRSGAGMFWMRAYLLVQPHPYMAITDAQGRFSLEQVPEGDYTLVCWHPDRRIVARERNPDNLRVMQVTFGPGLRLARPLSVKAGRPVELNDLHLGE